MAQHAISSADLQKIELVTSGMHAPHADLASCFETGVRSRTCHMNMELSLTLNDE